ncbi:MAG: ABC transporter transmembrane domain-containing protein, partial [Roseiflexus sp.]
HDQIGGIREIQIFNRQHLALERVRAVSHQLAHQQIGARRLMAALQPVVEGATGASIVLVVLLGGWLAQTGQLTVETLVAFILYLIGFYQPLYMLVGVSEALQRGLAGLRRVDEMLQLEPDVVDSPDGVVLGRANGAITFKGVSFAYRD